MNVQRQIYRLEDALANGSTKRSKIHGPKGVFRRANDTSLVVLPTENVSLTPGRRRMFELKIRQLKSKISEIPLWESKFADQVVPGKKPNGIYPATKPTRINGRVVSGTYEYARHGELVG